jgi:hypothetical protein
LHDTHSRACGTASKGGRGDGLAARLTDPVCATLQAAEGQLGVVELDGDGGATGLAGHVANGDPDVSFGEEGGRGSGVFVARGSDGQL